MRKGAEVTTTSSTASLGAAIATTTTTVAVEATVRGNRVAGRAAMTRQDLFPAPDEGGADSEAGFKQIRLADLVALQDRLGYEFNNVFLLISALDRTKLNTEGDGNTTPDYDSLEFIGDRVINLIAASSLVKLHPDADTSTLNDFYVSFIRNTDPHERGSRLHRVAVALDLASLINARPNSPLNAYGERGKGSNKKQKTQEQKLADHVEALFGAIFLDCGKDIKIVTHIFDQLFRRWLRADDHHTVYSGDSGETVAGGEARAQPPRPALPPRPSIPSRATTSLAANRASTRSPEVTASPASRPPPPSEATLSRAARRGGLFATTSSTSTSHNQAQGLSSMSPNALLVNAMRSRHSETKRDSILEALKKRLSNDAERKAVEYATKGQSQFLETYLKKNTVSNLTLNVCLYVSVKEKKTNVVNYLMKQHENSIAKEVFDKCLVVSNNNQAAYGFLKQYKSNRHPPLAVVCPETETSAAPPAASSLSLRR